MNDEVVHYVAKKSTLEEYDLSLCEVNVNVVEVSNLVGGFYFAGPLHTKDPSLITCEVCKRLYPVHAVMSEVDEK